jgi:hypothetical protein
MENNNLLAIQAYFTPKEGWQMNVEHQGKMTGRGKL